MRSQDRVERACTRPCQPAKLNKGHDRQAQRFPRRSRTLGRRSRTFQPDHDDRDGEQPPRPQPNPEQVSRQNRPPVAEASSALQARSTGDPEPQAKIVVLTFDDAVKDHRTFVAPYLRTLVFGQRFTVTHSWMVESPDPYASPGQYLTWQEIAENPRWGSNRKPQMDVTRLLPCPSVPLEWPVSWRSWNRRCRRSGVPRPVSYAHTGNQFGPEAIKVLKQAGYKLRGGARR